MELDELQQRAIELCCSTTKRIVSVTGQAGTGKTTIMRRVYDLLRKNGYEVVLCAPTGKAAKRIQEATGIEARTIHRLLEYPHPGERNEKTGKPLISTVPKRDRFNPLPYDVVLADEYAMVSDEVHRNLLDALPRGGCIRCFGDVNQLPPIESNKVLQNAPSPFTKMLNKFDSVTLSTVHRQDEGSGIVANGALILAGRMPKRLDDFSIRLTEQPVADLREFVIGEGAPDYSSLGHQILSPTNKGWVGTAELNVMLQRLFKREGVLELPRHPWDSNKRYTVGAGDKVIWTQNNYDLEVFNGETGIVKETTEFGEVVIDFGDRVLSVPPKVETVNRKGNTVFYDPRKDIDLAYCITTHKAQGSEFITIVYVLNKSSSWIQCRPNLYTAITRARKRVHLITDQFSLTVSIGRKRPSI